MPQPTVTKTRVVLPPPVEMLTVEQFVDGVKYTPVPSSTYLVTPFGKCETVTSVSHKKTRSHSNGASHYREGGPFLLRRFGFERQFAPQYSYIGGQNDPFLPYFPIQSQKGTKVLSNTSIPYLWTESDLRSGLASVAIPDIDLVTYSERALDKFSPLNPGANFLQFALELRNDGLPQIPGKLLKRLLSFRHLGSEYLNIEFGWKPFIADLRDLYKTQQSINSRLRQIIRDNNRPIRRRGKVYTSSNTVTSSISGALMYPENNFDATINGDTYKDGKLSTTTSVDVWFTGTFKYYIPDVTDDRWTAKAKSVLFGLNPTPAVLYEVMPWSWLIDWFSNVGDVINHLSANSIADLIYSECYLMRHFREEKKYEVRIPQRRLSNWNGTTAGGGTTQNPFVLTDRLYKETKERIAATPFGFGLQIGDLSDRQFAILTALGLSRSNF